MPRAERSSVGGVLRVAIAVRQVFAVVQSRDGWQTLPCVDIDAAQDGQGLLDPVIAALAQLQQAIPAGLRELQVLVADHWLAAVTLPWSSELHSSELTELQARSALVAAGCALARDDLVRIDDAPYGALRWVVAYPAALLGALQALAQAGGAHLSSVRPFSVAAWALPLRGSTGALGLCDAGLAMVIVGGRRITEVHVRSAEAGADGSLQLLQRLWQRLRLRDPVLAAVERLPVIALKAVESDATDSFNLKRLPVPALPGHAELPMVLLLGQGGPESIALDALASNRPAKARHWLPALAAGLVASLMAVSAWQAMGEARALRSELASAKRAVQPSAPAVAAWTREELVRVRAVNQAVRELNLPIDALLAALQPPRDVQVAVLGVEVGATTGTSAGTEGTSTLRIAAEAQSAIDMTRYVAHVAARRPLEGAYLLRHEVADKAAQDRRYRFTVEGTWRD